MGGWSIIYALINFALLALILYLFAKKLVIKAYKGHREGIAKELEASDLAREKAETVRAGLDELYAAGLEEAEQIVKGAQTQAEKNSHTAAIKREEELSLLGEASRSLLRRKEEAIYRQLNKEAGAAIIADAAAIIGSDGNAAARQALIRKNIKELEAVLKPTASDKMRMEKGEMLSARVISAEEPEPEAKAELAALVERTFDGLAETEFSLDKSLVAGFRLELGDTVYDASVQGQTERLAARFESGLEPELFSRHAREKISAMSGEIATWQTGRVISLSDGICRVSGLSDVMAGEMLAFEGELRGMVMDLEQNNVGVVLLGNCEEVQEGDLVRRTGRVIEVPVGKGMLGRVVDALGRPVDGMGEIEAEGYRAIESPAPGVVDRAPVKTPMQTGIMAVDALVPIGRGQRELIIGDRQTGKTAIAVDTIINQKDKDLICIYVAIGQKESTVAAVVEKLKEHGAMDYTIVLCANAFEPAPMLYIAPYSGVAMAEHFMYQGKDVLIVYDDLSKQAVAYREISLLLHRPPGREAYPGDVFYLHSRLLERAAKLSDERGGGSITALPIIETQAGDISAYIPTNVISITDGQIFLESDLFHSGIRPAVNVGLSVSRVGGSAQIAAMKQVAGRLRMDLAQYRELQAFSQLGSDLDKTTRATLHRGDRMTELLKQPQYQPMEAADQVIAIFAANEGCMDGIELVQVADFEAGLIDFVKHSEVEVYAAMRSGKKLDERLMGRLRDSVKSYEAQYNSK